MSALYACLVVVFVLDDAAAIAQHARDLGPAVLLFVIFVASADLGIAFLYRAAAGAAGDGESFRD